MKKAMVAVTAAIFILSAFSGCVGSIGTAPGMKNLDKAKKLAETRIDSPQLMYLESIEPFKNYTEDDYQVIIHADDNPGDGKAPGWMYTFYGNGKAMSAILLANGEILAEIWDESTHNDDYYKDVEPIENVKYDSDEIAKILEGEDRWPKMTEATNVIWYLEMYDGAPIWEAMATNLYSDDITYAYVYASNGTVLEIDSYDYSYYYGGYYDETEYDEYNYTEEYYENYAEESASGTAIPLSSFSATISIGDTGTVTLVTQPSLVVGTVLVELISDEYGVIWSYSPGIVSVGGQHTHTESMLPAGTYTAVVSASAGVFDGSIYLYGQW